MRASLVDEEKRGLAMRTFGAALVLGITWALGAALCASAWLLIVEESLVVVAIGTVLAGLAGALGGVALSEVAMSPYPRPSRRAARL